MPCEQEAPPKDINQPLWLQYYLERACSMVTIARSHGLPLREAMDSVRLLPGSAPLLSAWSCVDSPACCFVQDRFIAGVRVAVRKLEWSLGWVVPISVPIVLLLQVGEAWKEYTENTKHYSKMHFEANKRMLLRQELHKEFLV